jgi:hypothetical protein
MEWKDKPNAEGWWARRTDRDITWHYVDEYRDEEGGTLMHGVYMNELEDFIPIDKFCKPLVIWAGPIVLKTDTCKTCKRSIYEDGGGFCRSRGDLCWIQWMQKQNVQK